jgi:microsomal dipeptidase-like Zn-dependent dipeptidase
MSNLAFGGKLVHGAPSVGSLMPAVQMPTDPICRFDQRATSIAEALSQDGPTRGDPIQSRCGDAGRNAVIKVLEAVNGANTAPAGADGFPAFTYWPHWNDITHQKMWIDWIRRSWQYGQRVMVALSHNNRTLANLLGSGGPISGVKDDKASSALQIAEIKKLVADHPDFMEVADTPEKLRSIVQSGRLAVVLGVEIDKIGNFGPGVTAQTIDDEIAALHGQGVRYVLPIHLTDNVFGDTAIYDDVYNILNLRENNVFWSVGCALFGDEVGFRAQSFSAILAPLLPAGAPALPGYPSCLQTLSGGTVFRGHVNARTANGLTTLGDAVLSSLMKRGMIVDIDHMSDRAANRTLSRAAAVPAGGYPVMSGHAGIRNRADFGAENSRTTTQLARVACLGGMFGLGSGAKNGTRAVDWATQYARGYEVMRRAFAPGGLCPQETPLGVGFIGLGTDTNGLVKTPRAPLFDSAGPPRFTDIYNPNNPVNAGVSPLGRSTQGTRTWDYNTDGVAHYGMFADFLRDVRTLPANATMTGRQIVDDQMMYGADYFYRMWLKADTQKARVP